MPEDAAVLLGQGKPLQATVAKKLILEILENGTVVFTSHCDEELAKDGCERRDAVNVLRGGTVEPPEEVKGAWRYRVRTSRMYVVVEFDTVTRVLVVTAWRVK